MRNGEQRIFCLLLNTSGHSFAKENVIWQPPPLVVKNKASPLWMPQTSSYNKLLWNFPLSNFPNNVPDVSHKLFSRQRYKSNLVDFGKTFTVATKSGLHFNQGRGKSTEYFCLLYQGHIWYQQINKKNLNFISGEKLWKYMTNSCTGETTD